jgi:hypothetical protein
LTWQGTDARTTALYQVAEGATEIDAGWTRSEASAIEATLGGRVSLGRRFMVDAAIFGGRAGFAPDRVLLSGVIVWG